MITQPTIATNKSNELQNINDISVMPWQWNNHTFRAMNTNVSVWLYSQTDKTVLLDVKNLFASFEKQLSRFDKNSELSQLNATTSEIFTASPTLIDAVETALWAAEATAGLYDPTILKSLTTAGYDRSFEQMAQVAPLHLVPSNEGIRYQPAQKQRSFTFRSIRLNRAKREIIKPAGLTLDLGGMGKGWSVDRTADRLQGLGPFLINAGGDIFAYHSPPGQKGWEIDLVHPLKPDSFMARVLLHHQALATSTIAKRRWRHAGQVMHHLIDPRTGYSAQTDALSVTVTADRTVMAEVYAKVALILGAQQGLAYLQKVPGIEGLIYTAAGKLLYTPGFEHILDSITPHGRLNKLTEAA